MLEDTVSDRGRREKMRFRLPAVLAVALLALGAISCANSASPSSSGSGATIPLLKAGATEAAATLDAFKTGGCGPVYCGLMMEHLLKFGPAGKLEPVLATSWEQPSPVTYVYHLRHGVTFWDGKEMTSADVANSLNYARSPGSKTLFAFGRVKSVDATDKYTVTVTLSRPDASFKYSPSYEGPIFEKSFQDAHKATMGNPDVLIQATGPWKVDSFDPTRGLSCPPIRTGGAARCRSSTSRSSSTPTRRARRWRCAPARSTSRSRKTVERSVRPRPRRSSAIPSTRSATSV
jgi:peptide/nickel transport system substrate-binding protein